jgi:acetyl-CoA carboxylase carboxyl transferase subunit beta
MRLSHAHRPATERFALFDAGVFEEMPQPEVPPIRCAFRDERRYTDRLKDARSKTGRQEALCRRARHDRRLARDDRRAAFRFSRRLARHGVGESLVLGMQAAVAERRPFILFVSSGGARMQEGILSLMQMPRVTIGVDMLREAGLPYIVVLTDPTTAASARPTRCWAMCRSPSRAR